MRKKRSATTHVNSEAYDLLVLGSGAAGLSVVLRALELNPKLKIAVIAKNAAAGGSTAQAQGGIAAVFGSGDTLESHVQDTLDAGAGLCDRRVGPGSCTPSLSQIPCLSLSTHTARATP